LPPVVISDTSPVRYLVLIGQADLLPALYTELIIPEAVADELNQPATPEPVRRRTNFRIDPVLLDRLLTADSRRNK
jgi:predicted nucleic acid-binding protein